MTTISAAGGFDTRVLVRMAGSVAMALVVDVAIVDIAAEGARDPGVKIQYSGAGVVGAGWAVLGDGRGRYWWLPGPAAVLIWRALAALAHPLCGLAAIECPGGPSAVPPVPVPVPVPVSVPVSVPLPVPLSGPLSGPVPVPVVWIRYFPSGGRPFFGCISC